MEVLTRFSNVAKNGYLFGFGFLLVTLIKLVFPTLVSIYSLFQLVSESAASERYKRLVQSQNIRDQSSNKLLLRKINKLAEVT